MFTKTRVHIVLACLATCLLWVSPPTRAGGEPVLGRVLYSYSASVGAASAVKPETILSGDVLTTGADGSALLEFESGARVKVMENTTVRFVRDDQRIQVQLQSGAVIVQTSSSPTIAVSTSKHRFEPAQLGDCRYLVRLSVDQATTAAAMKGNVLIRPFNKSGSYLLREGDYAAIDADASGIPSPPGPMAPRSIPGAAQGKHGGWRIGSLSQGESIALEIGIAAGGAAGIAIPLSRSGSGPASPSAP